MLISQLIGVNFKKLGKIYHFLNHDLEVKINDLVIVETSRGVECSKVVSIKDKEEDYDVESESIKPIIRIASEEDLEIVKSNKEKEKHAFSVCVKKIDDHKLPMKLIDVEYTFDNSKVLFYFTSDGRIDFRNLVKDLAYIFKNRIELRQIGVRDQAKMVGGISVCGRELCCSSFLTEFQPVSIKMAKDQNLSLNPSKISGACGRLMCCLKYDHSTYEELIKITPRAGSIVALPDGETSGTVVDVNILTGLLRISVTKKNTTNFVVHRRDEVSILKEAEADDSQTPSELYNLE